MNPMRDFDILVSCTACPAAAGEDCHGLTNGKVHLGRRVMRLLEERGATVDDLAKAIETKTSLKGN